MELRYGVNISNDVEKLAKYLKDNYKLTDYEALILALKEEQNALLKFAFVVSSSDSHPTALEAIAIALGYKK